jgi:hypothetical protein
MNEGPSRHLHTGFTLAEMVASLCATSVLVMAVGVLLAGHQRGFNDIYAHTYASAAEGETAARQVFQQVVRQASSGDGPARLAADGSWLELQYRSRTDAAVPDRSARFAVSGSDLLLRRVDLDTLQSLSVQTVCTDVTSATFALTGNSAQMFLQLDDGVAPRVLNVSAVMRNP